MAHFKRIWPILFCALMPLIPLWRAIFLGQTIGPFDSIRQMAPWNGGPSPRPWDILQADAVLQFYPWRDMVFESWGKGQIPGWNPYELAGTPLLANSQSGALYPPHVLMGLLHVPTGLALTLLAWFHLFMAGLGTYFLTRKLGALKTGAALAAAGFALSSFMLAWTGLASVITTVCWIPWILGLIVALYAAPSEKPSRRFLFLALCVAMMVLGGHLQFVAYGMIAAVFLIVWLAVAGRKQSPLTPLAASFIAIAIGFGLAAPQLLPVLSYSQFSHRANAASEVGYTSYVGGALPTEALEGLAHPTALGNPANVSPLTDKPVKTPMGDVSANAYWPALLHPGADFAESAIGLGPLVFSLLLFLRRPNAAAGGVIAIGTIALLLALGTPLGRLLYFGVPGWSATGSPGRVGVLFVLACSALAGLAVSGVSRETPKTQKILVLLGVFAGLCLPFLPLAMGATYHAYDPRVGDAAQVVKLTLQNELPLILISAILAAGALLGARRRLAWILPASAVAIAALAYATSLIPASERVLPRLQAEEGRVAYVNRSWGLQLPSLAYMPPNTSVYSRIHEIGGYDSLIHRDTVNLLREIDHADTDPAAVTNGNMMFIKPGFDEKALGDAGVGKVTEIARDGSVSSRAVPTKGRAYTESGTAQIVDEGYDHIAIQAAGPGTLVLKDRNLPGWSAEVDGRRESIGGTLWRELSVGPGTHRVVFAYSPPGLSKGLIAAVAAGLLLLAIWLGGELTGRKRVA